MPNVKGLLTDPQFNALDMPTQKSILTRIDPTFGNLSDADFTTFRQSLGQPSTNIPTDKSPVIPLNAQTGPVGFQSSYVTPTGLHHRIPPDTPILGGPVLSNPEGIVVGSLTQNLPHVVRSVISMGTGLGAQQIAQHLGAPDWASTVAGLLVGGMAGGGTALFQKLSTLPSNLKTQAAQAVLKEFTPGVSKVNFLNKMWGLLHPDAKTSPPVPRVLTDMVDPEGTWTGGHNATTNNAALEPLPPGSSPTAWTGAREPQFPPPPVPLTATTDARALQPIEAYTSGPTPQGTGIPTPPVPPAPLASTVDLRALKPNIVPPGPIVQGTGLPLPPVGPLDSTSDPRALQTSAVSSGPIVQGTGIPTPPVPPAPLASTVDLRALKPNIVPPGPIVQGTGLPLPPVGPLDSTSDPRALQTSAVSSGPIVQGTGIPTPPAPLSSTLDVRAVQPNATAAGTPPLINLQTGTIATGSTNPGLPAEPTVTINVDAPGGVKKVQIPASAISTPPPPVVPSARAIALTKGLAAQPAENPLTQSVAATAPTQAQLFQPPPIPGEFIGRTTGNEIPASAGGSYGPGFGIYDVPIEKVSGVEDISGMPDKATDIKANADRIKAGSPIPPLFGNVDDQGTVQVEGARRLAAAKAAGQKTVPVAIQHDYQAPPPSVAPAAGQQSGLLQNLIKTVQSSQDANAEAIAEHAGGIGHTLTTNKNAVMANHLFGQGIDADKWRALPMDEKQAWVKKINAAQKTKYQPFGSNFRPGGYGRSAEEGARQVEDALRVLGAKPPGQ